MGGSPSWHYWQKLAHHRVGPNVIWGRCSSWLLRCKFAHFFYRELFNNHSRPIQKEALGQCLAHYIMGSAFIGYGVLLAIVLLAGGGRVWYGKRWKDGGKGEKVVSPRSQEWWDGWVIMLWVSGPELLRSWSNLFRFAARVL